LPGIAVANFWALGSTLGAKPPWPRHAFIAQFATFLLASYVVVFDVVLSPKINEHAPVAAVVIASLALAWMLWAASTQRMLGEAITGHLAQSGMRKPLCDHRTY
jgi:hypothetical protein